jgi:hypothetical protein
MMKDLTYIFTCTAAPVQAEGKICGNPFYFRSRHEHWSFGLSENPAIDPEDIDSPERGAAHGFFVEEKYGDQLSAASYMPLNEAGRIIESCAERYLRERMKGEI